MMNHFKASHCSRRLAMGGVSLCLVWLCASVSLVRVSCEQDEHDDNGEQYTRSQSDDNRSFDFTNGIEAAASIAIDGSTSPSFSTSSSINNEYHHLGFIAWYCFVAVCMTAPGICCIAFGCRKCQQRRHRIMLEAIERRERLDREISRIEANVQIFSELEQFRRGQILQKTMIKQTNLLSAEDFKMANDTEHERKFNKSCTALELSSGCRICLEEFVVGDVVMHSVNRHYCHHVFHKDCIVSWLVSRPEPICPCCRQDFASTTPNTSISSHHEFVVALGVRDIFVAGENYRHGNPVNGDNETTSSSIVQNFSL